MFDVNRQICDFKLNVDNCDITAGKITYDCDKTCCFLQETKQTNKEGDCGIFSV